MEQYKAFSDEQLIDAYRNGEEQAVDVLIHRYKFLVRKKANALFLFGGDTDDLIQEGMIGLFQAVRDYNATAGSFSAFAELCITRQLYTAIAAASRKKHMPLNSYVSLSDKEKGIGTYSLPEQVALCVQSPEQFIIERERFEQLLQELTKRLSALEKKVLTYYLEGLHYRQIAAILEKPEKSMDNAIQRIRKKAQQLDSVYDLSLNI